MAGHLLPLGGEGGAVALLHRLDVHAHGCSGEERGLGGGGVEKREEPEVRRGEISKAKPDFTGFSADRIKRPSKISVLPVHERKLICGKKILVNFNN